MKLLQVGERDAERTVLSYDGQVGHDITPLVMAGLAPLTAEGVAELAGLTEEQRGELPRVSIGAERIGSPVGAPGKIVCVGLNYRQHALEAGMAIPAEPILFMKAPYTAQGPNDDVIVPPGSEKTDYEVELAIVIGKRTEYLASPSESRDHILGYAISNDVSERSFQLERGGEWDKGKNCDTFNPIGPWVVTADQIEDPQNLRLLLSVNGEERQSSSTADMIFGVDYLVWYVSQFMTLLPGDVINSGTPQGVGSGFNPARFLRDGDIVEVSIENLGKQVHRLVNFDRQEKAA